MKKLCPPILPQLCKWLKSWHRVILRYIRLAVYWLQTHTYNRYHMLDIRNKHNGYAWGWMDRSEGILFANMAILVDFIEEEKAWESNLPDSFSTARD